MKKALLTKLMLLLCALIAGSSSVWAVEVTDVLNLGFTGVSSYSDWAGKTSKSDAVYAGNSGAFTSGGNSAISLRSTNYSGIITTSPGKIIKRITVTWNSNTTDGRKIDIYGKKLAYSAASDLYNNGTKGTKLGSIEKGASTSIEVAGDYTYIGIRSYDGALYLDEIQITWDDALIWDLSTDNTATATTTEMTWNGTSATMRVDKDKAGTNTNNYYPGTVGQTYNSTRLYTSSILAINPVSGYAITDIIFTATTSGYATTLEGSTWTNASATVNGMIVTVTPTDGTAAVFATIGGVCGLTEVEVYYNPVAKVPLAAACTDGGKYYGTYSNSSAFVVPADLTVSCIGVSDGKLVVKNYETGDVVKANTGVMVSSTTSGDHTVTLSTETGTEKDGNLLKPAVSAITADDMSTAASGCKYYRLTMHNATSNPPGEIGFWWGAADGAAFALGANKAYLAVPTGISAPEFFWFDSDGNSTSISEVRSNMEDVKGNVYDLQGRKVANPTKGLYIVNGKKYMVK